MRFSDARNDLTALSRHSDTSEIPALVSATKHDFSRLRVYPESDANRDTISIPPTGQEEEQKVKKPEGGLGPILAAAPRASEVSTQASLDHSFPRTPAHAEKYYLGGEPTDDKAKVEPAANGKSESGFIGALIGGGAGAGIGALIGGLVGGPLGALVGGAIGAVAGAIAGALIGGAGGGITWKNAGYVADGADANSTTVEEPFQVAYKAEQDKSKNVWRMRASSIEGGVNINVHTGGSRDPVAAPPVSEAEAKDAVTDMKGYYTRGSRGKWHTEAASHRHEQHHEREWKGTAEHYWPVARNAIETMTVPLSAHADEGSAITAMRTGPTGADAKVAALSAIAHAYWFTLSDSAASRPYAAGQLALNDAVRSVQRLAAGKGWAVPQGTDSPSPEPPCYQPWLPFAP